MGIEAEARFVWITLLTTPSESPESLVLQRSRWNARKKGKE
jgi:hypothetical protein